MSDARQFSPVHILPFQLHDISEFKVGEHPVFHPLYELHAYQEYWTEQVDYCLRGKWGYDYNEETGEGGWRFMPGNLYFYVNMGFIRVEGEEGRESIEKPLLRDVEWLMFYALTECDGFSGFEDDPNHTCFLPLGKLQGKVFDDKGKKITKLTNAEKIGLEKKDKHLRKPNGEYKEYITPRDALYRTYDAPVGRPMFLNNMKNLVILGSRGFGKSYSIGIGVIQYDFVFGSARTTDEFFQMQSPSNIVVGAYDSSKSKSLLDKFKESYEYMRKNVATHPECDDINSVFYQPYEGSLQTGNFITNRVKEQGGKSFTGTGSKIWHVTYKDNPRAGVGERARRMIVEEAGLLANFKEVHAENVGSQKRESKTGYTVYIGTGGDVTKIQGIRDAFYNPSSYDCAAYPDIFSSKPGNIGLFIPAYYRSNTYKDKNGNTNVELAFEDEIAIRNEMKGTGAKSYEGQIISYPIIPSEMFLQASGNCFPTALLEHRLTDLETGLWDRLAKPGKLQYVDKEKTRVVWTPLPIDEANPITRYGGEKGRSDEAMKGSIVIYEHPVPYRPQLTHYNYMYIVCYDSISDEDGGTSLACVTVWKFYDFEDSDSVQLNLVAEWIGRHIGEGGLDKDHEMAFALATYYDAPIAPEINLKDVRRYGRMTNRYHYFLPRPSLALKGMVINSKKEYDIGLEIVPGMKPDLEVYLNESLNTQVDNKHTIVGNEEKEESIKMASQIPSMRMCEELLYYSRDGNFDMVSTGFIFGVYHRQRISQPVQDMHDKEEEEKKNEFLNFLRGDNNEVNYDHPAFSY